MIPSEWALLKEGLPYVPSLAISLAIIIIFVRYLDARDKRDVEKEIMLQKDFDKRDAVLKEISNRGFAVHQESNQVIKENTHVMGEVKHALDTINRK